MHTCATPPAIAIAALLACLSPLALGAERDSGTVVAGDLGQAIDTAIQRSTSGAFWGSVMVARDGEVILAKGYGFADYGSTPSTPDTLFEIASASKQVTAATILHLQAAGKLSVEDPLAKFFADVPADKAAITLYQLITHTSGIDGNVGVPYAYTGEREEYVRAMLARPLAGEPGASFAYANMPYALLAAVVEVASGQSFEDYVRKQLFAPAGMDDSGFIRDPRLTNSKRAVAARLAESQPDSATAANWHWGWGYRGMGGVVTTAWDLRRWDLALRKGELFDEETLEVMFRPALGGYACGWFVQPTAHGRKAVHGGGVAGFRAYLVRSLDQDLFVAVLTNEKGNCQALEATILEIILPPSRITATIDVTPYELSQHAAALLGESVAISVEGSKGSGEVALALDDTTKEHRVATIRLPRGEAEATIHKLRAAAAARERGAAGEDAIETGIYLGGFQLSGGVLELERQLDIVVRDSYHGVDAEGNSVVDNRVTFILKEGVVGQWPVMFKLGKTATANLVEQLERALQKR